MATGSIQYSPPPTIKEFIRDYAPGEWFANWIIGPVGCLAGRTLVVTESGAVPIADITQPTRVLSRNARTGQYQLSWCGGSFPKGKDYLYRVVTPQGEFDAAGAHLLLCADGEYREVQALQAGDVLAEGLGDPLWSAKALSWPACVAGANRCPETVADCLGGYAALVRRYGLPLLQGSSSGLSSAPSPADAQTGTLRFYPVGLEHEGVRLGHEPIHSRADQSADHLQTTHSESPRGSVQAAEAVTGAVVPYARDGAAGQGLRQSLRNWCGRLQAQLLPALRRWTQGFGAWCSPQNGTNRAIISVTRLDTPEIFWDLQVEGTHNYVTVDGAVHHNSGKTTGIFFKLAYMASLQTPSPRDGIRRSRAVIVRNTMPQLRDTTITSWNYWFKDPQAGSWKASENKFLLKFGDVECEVLFRPLDTPDDVARVLSLEVTFAILDEFVQLDKSIVEALAARCGRFPPQIDGGATNWGMWGSSNPGNEDSWWYEKLEENVPANWAYYKQPNGFSADAENVENLPGKEAYYTSLAEGKSEHWIKQFIEGCWGFSLDGTPVLKTFNSLIHVSSRPLKFNPHLPLVAGLDPGLAGSGLIFGQMDHNGRLMVTSELVQKGYGVDRLCTERLRPHLRLKYPNLREFHVSPDPAATGRSNGDEKSVLDALKKNKVPFKFADMNNSLASRIQSIEYFSSRLTSEGPALVIDPECKTLIRALQTGWRYKLKKDDEQSPEPEKNQWSHPADAFGYLCKWYANTDPEYTKNAKKRFTMGASAPNYHMR